MLNQSQWAELHKNARNQPAFPTDDVVRFVKRNFKEGASVLDDGCGAGRHLLFLAQAGYDPFGVDYSESGVLCSRERLAAAGFARYADQVVQASCDSLPYPDESFEGVISYGVLYYMGEDGIAAAISEIYRVLKPGGKCLLQVRSTGDYRYDKKRVVGENGHSCRIEESDPKRSAYQENGMIMHFFTREELELLLKDFTEVEINTEKRYHENDAYADVNYLVTFQKE